MRELRRLGSPQLHRQTFDYIFEFGMSPPTSKKIDKVLAQRALLILGHPFLLATAHIPVYRRTWKTKNLRITRPG
jgi:hypothetical protein